jgi:hypothetical protein
VSGFRRSYTALRSLRAPSPGIRNLDACRKRCRSSRQSSHRRAASFLERISSERAPRWSDSLVSTTRQQHFAPRHSPAPPAAARAPQVGNATAAPPISAMNSRRPIPKARRQQVGVGCGPAPEWPWCCLLRRYCTPTCGGVDRADGLREVPPVNSHAQRSDRGGSQVMAPSCLSAMSAFTVNIGGRAD